MTPLAGAGRGGEGLDAAARELLAGRRLRAQRLTGASFSSPEEVVGHLGAVQAQDYDPAKWSVGARLAGATDDELERAFASGAILRTHVLRPTWHFVLPADIRWLLTATAPRIRMRAAGRNAQLGLDDATLWRAGDVLAAALRGGEQLTRAEAGAVLRGAGIDTEGQRLPHLLMHAELEALICSGPRRGRQHTYMLLEERAPGARDLPREKAIAELARRYFTGHGPATVKDFARWSSLTLAEARGGIEAAGDALRLEEIGGLRCWSGADDPAAGGGRDEPADAARGDRADGRPRRGAPAAPAVRLVQGYDEYIMGYSETKGVLAGPGSSWSPATPPVFTLVILRDGRVGGFWKRTAKKDRVIVEAALLDDWGAADLAALETEAGRYGQFLGLPAELILCDAGGSRCRRPPRPVES